jgi:hypothetical protein
MGVVYTQVLGVGCDSLVSTASLSISGDHKLRKTFSEKMWLAASFSSTL